MPQPSSDTYEVLSAEQSTGICHIYKPLHNITRVES